MKNLLIKLLVIIPFLLNPIILIQAQNLNDIKAEGGLVQYNLFDFEGTDQYDLILPITNQPDTFRIEIKAYIGFGDLSIEIIDPSGESLGNFIVKGQSDISKSFKFNFIMHHLYMETTRMHIKKEPAFFTYDEYYFKHSGMGDKVAQASISRLFKAPMNGDWVVKAVCNKAKGFFTVENNGKLVKSNMPTEFVNGTVVDNKNRPIPGAIIKSKNGYAWTTSDAKGEFTVSLRDQAETRGEPEIIEVRYKKMVKEVIIGDQPKITVVLESRK
jgi:hypothetical protein